MQRTGRQGGFSLIELIVVITILCILAAFAVPRFAEFDGRARSAEATALAAELRAGAALAHALWLAEDRPESVRLEDREITLRHGYPDTASIDDTLLELDGFVYDASGPVGRFLKTNERDGPVPGCGVQYTPAPASGAAPAITLDTSGC